MAAAMFLYQQGSNQMQFCLVILGLFFAFDRQNDRVIIVGDLIIIIV